MRPTTNAKNKTNKGCTKRVPHMWPWLPIHGFNVLLKPLIPNNLERSMSSSYIEYNTTDMDVLGENLPYSNLHTNRKVGPQEILKTSNSVPFWKYVSICLILSLGNTKLGSETLRIPLWRWIGPMFLREHPTAEGSCPHAWKVLTWESHWPGWGSKV